MSSHPTVARSRFRCLKHKTREPCESVHLAEWMRNESGVWSLSPAYDVTFAYHPDSIWLRQHLMSVNGKFQGITEKDLLVLADQFEVPNARQIIGEVSEVVANWATFAAQAGIGTERVHEVQTRLNEVSAELRA